MNKYLKTNLLGLTCLCAAMAPVQAQVPVGNWLKMDVVKSVLTNGWQRALDTDKDPANNNQWNTHDAGNGNGIGGLFGLVQETMLATQFDTARRYPVQFVSQKTVKVPNGTDSPVTNSVNLEYTTSVSVTDTSSASNSLKTGAEISFKVSASAFGIGAEEGGKFSEEFTRTTATSNTKTTVRSEKFSNTLTVVVPPKRTYSVSVTCQEEKVDLQYRSNILLTGISRTWFPDRVNGHFNWNQNIGGVLSHSNNLPAGWQLPGDGSVLVLGAQGTLTAQQSTNCTAAVADVTNANNNNTLQSLRGSSTNHSVPAGGVLISVTPLRR